MRNVEFWVPLLALGLSGCFGQTATDPVDPSDPTPREQSTQQSTGPADPYATKTVLTRSAAVIEGIVRDIKYSYDEHTGPRTVVSLDVTKVHAGTYDEPRVELRMLGGPTPDGRFMSTSETVDFAIGKTYIVFLTNQSWFYSPMPAAPLRVERVAGKEVLLNPQGHPMTGLSPRGLRFGYETVFQNSIASSRTTIQTTTANPRLVVAGSLDRAGFGRVLREAIAAEGVSPSKKFNPLPEDRGPNWRVEKTAPPSAATP